MKLCYRCRIEKRESEFSNCYQSSKYPICRECVISYGKKYRDAHRKIVTKRNCLKCGKEFISKLPKHVYCSKKCAKSKAHLRIKIKESFSCRYCGKTFHPKYTTKWNKYCSREHAFLDWEKVHGKKKGPFPSNGVSHVYFPKCSICGKLFTARNKQITRCSEACDKAHESWVSRETNKKKFKSKRIICKYCNKEFDTEYGSPRQSFCSDKCSKSYSNFNRKEKLFTNGYEFFSPYEIFLRDGWKCQLCNGKVNKKLKHPHPLSPSIDHIIPLSQGGKHNKSNCQLAHFACNYEKNIKVTSRGNQLRLNLNI